MTPRRRLRAEAREQHDVPAHFDAPLTERDTRPASQGADPQPIGDVVDAAMVDLAEQWRRRADGIMEQVDMRHPSATALIRHARVLRESAGEMGTALTAARRRRDKLSAPADSITEHPPEGTTA